MQFAGRIETTKFRENYCNKNYFTAWWSRYGLRPTRPPRYDENMIIGKVVGTIVTTISHAHYKNRRLLVVQPFLAEGGEKPDDDFIALDNSHAGIGETVLVNREGNGARQVLGIPDGCVISVIVGIVDSVSVEG